MAAPEGNTNAEKWTEEATLEMLAEIEKHAKRKTCLWLGSALVKCGLYKEIWSMWKRKFEGNEIVFQPIKRIEAIFEDRLFSLGLSGELNTTMAIFGLKNNHDWTDKKSLEHSGPGGTELKQVIGMIVTDAEHKTDIPGDSQAEGGG